MEREPVRDNWHYGRPVRAWLSGRGLLATHTGLFVVAATALTLINIVRSPADLWVWQPLLVWVILLAIHAILVLRLARMPAAISTERRAPAPGAAARTTVGASAQHYPGQAFRTISSTRGRLIDGTSRSAALWQDGELSPEPGWEAATHTWHDVPTRRTGLVQSVKDGSRRTRNRATTIVNHGKARVEQRLDTAQRTEPGNTGEAAVPPIAPSSTWSATAEPAVPTTGDHQAPPTGTGEWVPPAVEALRSANGAAPAPAPAPAEKPAAPPAATPTNGAETWPEKPVSPNLASPTIRLVTTPERERDVVGYQQQPASPTEDVVLSGPAPRIEQPRQWSELQAEAAAWLAHREEDIGKSDNSATPSLMTPSANGHHPPKRAQG